jgi:hypothetical protein
MKRMDPAMREASKFFNDMIIILYDISMGTAVQYLELG